MTLLAWLGLLTASLVGAVRGSAISIAPDPSPPLTAPSSVPCPQWFDAALSAGWTPEQWPDVGRIMFRESRCDPGAVHHNANGSVDRGLMQINSVHLGWLGAEGITAAGLLDGPTNLRAAHDLWERSGWTPWKATR